MLSSRPRNVSLWNVTCERSDVHKDDLHIDQQLMKKLQTYRLGTSSAIPSVFLSLIHETMHQAL